MKGIRRISSGSSPPGHVFSVSGRWNAGHNNLDRHGFGKDAPELVAIVSEAFLQQRCYASSFMQRQGQLSTAGITTGEKLAPAVIYSPNTATANEALDLFPQQKIARSGGASPVIAIVALPNWPAGTTRRLAFPILATNYHVAWRGYAVALNLRRSSLAYPTDPLVPLAPTLNRGVFAT
ncbi:hypothetical protein L226DRAFT_219599 [Lentinus tigrinus ALCF2SS1-7]|uniref:Uncharacterized protein n=1 Tax=Lentinus tigrinus ALCF2SS1-6 TaxID=1328759 RepID=A0A5C2S6D4_9APHY|nr:hypothetical protein L227DRAFT_159520 [Lentinus tigrinus ALCF2SS1-6]RPD70765.1 hypothetical protein L226DRAFT_219599 [Lentinus tigrinus ALCF2SS1-7]